MKTIIISAAGKQTFTRQQIDSLQNSGPVDFIKNIQELSIEDFIALANQAEVLGITRRTIKNISASILEQLPCLKGIALYATGYEWIDLNCAHSMNITVNYLPGYSAQTVAEHTLGLVLCMCRRIHLSHDKTRKLVPENTSIRGTELRGKTVGIAGLGTIGKIFARLLAPFDVSIVYYDIKKQDTHYAYTQSIDELSALSDIIVLLTPQARGQGPLIGKSEISKMKKGVYIINTSRASLVDNQAVKQAIHNDSIAGYAVDDTVDELLTDGLEPGRILQTGHSAWYSDEAIARGTQQWADNIISLMQNKPINIIQ